MKILQFLPRLILTLLMLTVGVAYFIFNGILAIITGILGWDTGIWLVSRLWSYGTYILLLKTVRIRGQEHLQTERPVILLANHSSLFDIPALYLFTPRAVAWLAKGSLFKVPVMGWVLSSIGSIAIDRENARRTHQNMSARLAHRRDKWIAIFPEGTRSPDGKIQPLKKGFIKVMRLKEMDIQPVTLSGFYSLLPKKGQWLINPFVPLEITIHPVISYQGLREKTDAEILEIVSGQLNSVYHP